MKRPQPDLEVVTVNNFVNTVGHIRKMKRLWGTTTINVDGQNVEVLTPRQYYHPADARKGYNPVDPSNPTSKEKLPKEFVKLFNFLDVYDQTVLSSKKGLRKAWLYFNKNNVKSDLVNPNEFVADNLNKLFWDSEEEPPEELKLTTTIVIDALQDAKFTTFLVPEEDLITRGMPTTPLLDKAMTTQELIDAVTLNYEELWDTCIIWQEGIGIINKGEIVDPETLVPSDDIEKLSPEDPWLSLLSRYALRDYGVPCTVTNVEVTMREALTDFTTSKQVDYVDEFNVFKRERVDTVLYTSYTVTLEIPYTTFGTQSLFVSQIANDLDAEYLEPSRFFLANSNEYYSQKAAQAYDSSDEDDDFEIPVVTRPYVFWEDASISADPRFDDIWVRSNVGNWYLRADAFIRPSDYGLKFKELAEYVFSLIDVGVKKKKTSVFKKIIAAIVFIVAVIYAPPLMNWAQAILFGSLVLSVLSVVFSVLGMESWAIAFAEVNRTIEPLVMVASIYVVANGLIKGLEKTGTDLTLDSVLDAAGDYISNMADDMINEIVQGATDVFAGNFTTNAALKFTNVVAKIGMMPAKMKLADLNARNKDLKAEYQDLVQEMSREYDVLQGFARVYASPATADWSIYAEVYDLPYERGGGPLAMGNIQRTTKQAIRKADYSDPIFDNILVV